MTRGGMLDVILVGDDDPDVAGDERRVDGPGARHARPFRAGSARPAARGPAADPDVAAGPRRSGVAAAQERRRRRLLVGGAVVLTLVGAAVLDDGRARDRADRLADVPGLLAPLERPPGESWRAPGGAAATVTVGHGLVTSLVESPDHALVAVDAGTGQPLWTAPLPEVSDSRDLECVSVDTTAAVAPEQAGPGRASHLVCRVVTERASVAEGAQGFAASRLVVLDARTGARVGERPLAGRYSTLTVADPDVLVVELQRDGHGTVVREDPVTGSVRWTFRTSRPLPDLGDGLPVPRAQVQHGVIAVDGPAAWALTPAGSVLAEWYPRGTELARGVRRAVDLTVLRDGRFAVTDATVGGAVPGAAATTVSVGARPGSGARGAGAHEPAARMPGPQDGFAIPGRVLTPVVDDGSAPDVLLTVPVGAGQVVAVDARSGRELWRAEIRVGGQAVLLDGRLVTGWGRGVRALDVRSGAVRWVAGPQVIPSGPALLSDGDVVLVPVLQSGRRPVLVALGLTDGRERWRAASPAGVSELRVTDGRVLAFLSRETVGLR